MPACAMISASRFLDSYSGYRALRAGLITDTYLEAMVRARHFLPSSLQIVDRLRLQEVIKHKLNYDEFENDAALERRIDEASDEPDIYGRLARSIAPEIFGSCVNTSLRAASSPSSPTRACSRLPRSRRCEEGAAASTRVRREPVPARRP